MFVLTRGRDLGPELHDVILPRRAAVASSYLNISEPNKPHNLLLRLRHVWNQSQQREILFPLVPVSGWVNRTDRCIFGAPIQLEPG